MDDEDGKVTLEPEEVQQIINWAVGTSALVTLMQHAEEHHTVEQAMERLEGYIDAIDTIYVNIPECLMDTAHEMAAETIEESDRQEYILEQFRKEIEDL